MLILLSGYSRSGKDAIAKHLPGTRLAFADAMKELYCVAAGVAANAAELEADKERHRPRLVEFGRKGREIDPSFWINPVMANICVDDEASKITDVRYWNECDAIRRFAEANNLEIHVFYISRPGIGPANDEEANSIAEIRRLLNLPVIDNDSTPEAAAAKIMELVKGTVKV